MTELTLEMIDILYLGASNYWLTEEAWNLEYDMDWKNALYIQHEYLYCYGGIIDRLRRSGETNV